MKLRSQGYDLCQKRWHQKVAFQAVQWLRQSLEEITYDGEVCFSVAFATQPNAPLKVTRYDMKSRPPELHLNPCDWRSLKTALEPAKAQLASAFAHLVPEVQAPIKELLSAASLPFLPVQVSFEAVFDPEAQGSRPELIRIAPDDYQAKYLGHTQDGRQFLLTAPFDPALGNSGGAEFLALYLFDDRGNFLEAEIESFGPRDVMSVMVRQETIKKLLDQVSPYQCRTISIKPFELERFDYTFGLVVLEPETDEAWSAFFTPGRNMIFYPPWDSGEYDT